MYVAVHKADSMRFHSLAIEAMRFLVVCCQTLISVFGRSAGDKAETEHQGLTSGATQQPLSKTSRL